MLGIQDVLSEASLNQILGRVESITGKCKLCSETIELRLKNEEDKNSIFEKFKEIQLFCQEKEEELNVMVNEDYEMQVKMLKVYVLV